MTVLKMCRSVTGHRVGLRMEGKGEMEHLTSTSHFIEFSRKFFQKVPGPGSKIQETTSKISKQIPILVN